MKSLVAALISLPLMANAQQFEVPLPIYCGFDRDLLLEAFKDEMDSTPVFAGIAGEGLWLFIMVQSEKNGTFSLIAENAKVKTTCVIADGIVLPGGIKIGGETF